MKRVLLFLSFLPVLSAQPRLRPVPLAAPGTVNVLVPEIRSEYWKRSAAQSKQEALILNNELMQVNNRAHLEKLTKAVEEHTAVMRADCASRGEELVTNDKTGDPACMKNPKPVP